MQQMTIRRKLAIATWSHPQEGNIYGRLSLDVHEAERYIAWLRETTGEKVTITHFIGKAIGLALEKTPSLNGRIWLGKYIPHDTVRISFLVALEEGGDLGKAKLSGVEQMNVADIAAALREKAQRLHKGEDDDFNKAKGTIKLLPTWLLKPLLGWIGWLGGAGGYSIPALGVDPYPFGSAVITSVGMLGVDEGFAPPTPFAHCPVWVCIGAIQERPAVVNGEVVPRRQLTLTATLDHRFIDGFQGGNIARMARDLFENPWQLSGLDGPPEELEAAG